MDLGADPVHGERHQPHADLGVEALDGLHQADVAFLDEIAHRQAIATVAARDVDDEAQVRQHELARGVEVVVAAQPAREGLFVLAAQHRDAADGVDIGVEAADRAGKNGVEWVTSGKGSWRSWVSEGPPVGSAILAVRPLEC